MKRRDAIKRTGLMLGYAISASALAGVMNGCVAEPTSDGITWKPSFLKEDQASLVAEIAERIMPATNTPGAKDVGVPQFIDEMLNSYYKPYEKEAFTNGLASFTKSCQEKFSQSFEKCSNKQRDELLTEYMKSGKKEDDANKDKEDTPTSFFFMMKELTLLGYFSSEKVGTELLNYDPVPGEYIACMPLADVDGKAWTH